jgi:hypothetical protein
MLIVGCHGAAIAALHFLESKDLFEVNWDFLKMGLMGESGFLLWKLVTGLSNFI